jgi:hypothetical protein
MFECVLQDCECAVVYGKLEGLSMSYHKKTGCKTKSSIFSLTASVCIPRGVCFILVHEPLPHFDLEALVLGLCVLSFYSENLACAWHTL